jgi:polysaccharide deacetylase family protein (PEP-CTERM system associated)
MTHAFSIDVEDWYQVSDFEEIVEFSGWRWYESRIIGNTERVLGLLAEARVKATFFILAWNAERHPALPRMIAAAGHEVASHGYAHRLVYEIGRDNFRADVERSKKLLEDLTGREVIGYRAPSFSITARSLWALDVLLDLGFQYDSSILPVRDQLYGIPNAHRFPYPITRAGLSLTEFPVSTVRVAGRALAMGGAYLRLMPYACTRWGVQRIEAEGQPALIYLHPWELDPTQPRLRVRGKRGFSTHYLRLRSTEGKVRRLLADFSFAPIADVLGCEPVCAGATRRSAASGDRTR